MIEWGVSFKDGVSQPADAAASAMGRAADAANKMHEHVSGLAGAWEVFEGSLAARLVERAFDAIVDSGRGLISMSIEASERVAHLSEVFGALSGASEDAAGATGKAIFDLTRSIAKELPQSEAMIQSWARSLMAAGVTDMTKLTESLRAVSGAEALVEGGGEKVRGMLAKLSEASEKGTKFKFSIAQLAGTGVTESEFLKQIGMTAANFEAAKKHGQITGTAIAEALTRAIGEKAAGPLAGQMGELSTVITKAKDSAMQLLEGVNPKPLVDGIKMLLSVFDATQPSGKLLKDILTGAFDAIFTVAGKLFAFLKTAFLQLMIWGLQVAIWLKPIIRDFTAWLEKVHAVDILITALKGIGIVLGSLAAALGIVVVAAIAVGTGIGLATAAVVGFVAWIIGMVPKAGEALGDLTFKAVQAGGAFIDGLVNGIKGGITKVTDAVTGVAKSAYNAVTGFFGIHSPSTLMFGVGANIGEGTAQGLESTSGRVEAAALRATTPGANVASGGGGSSSSSVTVHVEAGAVVISAGAHISEARVLELTEEGFGSLANRLAAMIGSAPVPA